MATKSGSTLQGSTKSGGESKHGPQQHQKNYKKIYEEYAGIGQFFLVRVLDETDADYFAIQYLDNNMQKLVKKEQVLPVNALKHNGLPIESSFFPGIIGFPPGACVLIYNPNNNAFDQAIVLAQKNRRYMVQDTQTNESYFVDENYIFWDKW